MTEFSVTKLIENIRQTAQQKPDYAYDKNNNASRVCQYVDTETQCPSCIVGQGLWPMLDEAQRARLESVEFNNLEIDMLLDLFFASPVELSDSEFYWLSEVQKYQDRGMPWGEAVRKADIASDATRKETNNDDD